MIGLARRPERLVRFWERWEASGWSNLLGTPSHFLAIDGIAAQGRPDALVDLPEVYGCWASHVEVLRAALEDDVQCLAVFEDDAIPQPQSAGWLGLTLASLPTIAQGLWLDASWPGNTNRFMHASFGAKRLLHPPLLTHGYLLTQPLIVKLYETASLLPARIDQIYMHLFGVHVFAAVPSLLAQEDWPEQKLQLWREDFSPQRSNA